MKAITLKYKKGIHDLKGLFAYLGNSQWYESGSNELHFPENYKLKENPSTV